MLNKDITQSTEIKGDGIVSFLDNSTYKHPVANEFVFSHNGNKYRIQFRGGGPKPKCGIAMWKFISDLVQEEMHTYGYFNLNKTGDELIDIFTYYRNKILPIDDAPVTPLQKTFGFLQDISTLSLLMAMLYRIDDKKFDRYWNGITYTSLGDNPAETAKVLVTQTELDLSKKNTSIEEIIKEQYQYSPYLLYRLIFEKVIAEIIDENTVRIWFPKKINARIGGVLSYRYNGFYTPIGSFYTNLRDQYYIDLPLTSMPYSSCSDYRTFKSLKNNDLMIENKSPSFLKVKTSSNTYILKPYGITKIDSEPVSVEKAPRLTVEIDYMSTSIGFMETHKEFTNIHGYNVIPNCEYYFSDKVRGINHSKEKTQIGPMESYSSIYKVPLRDYVILNKRKYKQTTQDEEGNSKTIDVTKQYEIKTNHKDIFYREHGELEFKNAILKNGAYYTHDGVEIGKELFKKVENNIDESDELVYERSFKYENGKVYKLYHYVYNPRGIKLYDLSKYKCPQTICGVTNFSQANVCRYPSYTLGNLIEYNETYAYVHNDVTGDTEKIEFKISEFPGLKADNGMTIIAGGIVNSDVLDDGMFKNLRSYNGSNGKAIYFVVSNGIERKVILLPQTSITDTFIDVDNGGCDGMCKNPLRKGEYECKIDEEAMPKLIGAVADVEPFARNIRTLNNYFLPTQIGRGGITPGIIVEPSDDEFIWGIRPYFFNAVGYSQVVEFVDNYNYSVLLNKKIAVSKEIGLVLDNDSLGITEEFDISIYKDQNERGVILRANDVKVLITVKNDENHNKIMEISINKGSSEIDNVKVPFIPFYADESNYSATPHAKLGKYVLFFAWEGFANYLVKNEIFLNILVDADESEGLIDDEKIEFRLSRNTKEGERPVALLDGKELEIINTPGAIYYIHRGLAFPAQGEFKVVALGNFLYNGFTAKTDEEFIEKTMDIIKERGKELLCGYELYKPVNMHFPYKLLYDTHFLALEDKTFTVPKDERVEVSVYLGYGNTFRATKPFNTIDNPYFSIKGAVTVNKIEGSDFRIEYDLPIEEIALKRKIDIDLEEHASWFDTYYHNAKEQLIQPLREDTDNKRFKGRFISVEFDTQEIYDQIKTLNTGLWALPVNFRCANIPDEARIKTRIASERIESTELTFDDVYNQGASKVVFFDNCDTVNLSLDNALIEADTFATYDMTKIVDRINRKEFMYNDDNTTKYATKNISLKDKR